MSSLRDSYERITSPYPDVSDQLPPGLKQIGFIDYNDLATSTAPIAVPGTSTFVDISNDGLGPFTNKTYAPEGITDVWDANTNLFDFTQLSLGDVVGLRVDLQYTTNSNNQEVDLYLELASSLSPYDLAVSENAYKSSGIHNAAQYIEIYIGDTNTLNGGGKFKVRSDGTLDVLVRGWACVINKSI